MKTNVNFQLYFPKINQNKNIKVTNVTILVFNNPENSNRVFLKAYMVETRKKNE